MASTSEANKTSSTRLPGTLTKLPPIPKGAKVHKRPIPRRQPPASSKSRIIYVSTSAPFMAIVKRARKQLDSPLRSAGAAPKNATLHSRIEALKKAGGETLGDGSLVTVMGTGRAVEKTLSVASWFEQAGDCDVQVRTRTVGAVDDIVVEDGDVEDETRVRRAKGRYTL
ncbi:Fc.00g059560.m01.CDS01 [Cosmosporella sp. VM-42]